LNFIKLLFGLIKYNLRKPAFQGKEHLEIIQMYLPIVTEIKSHLVKEKLTHLYFLFFLFYHYFQ